MTRNMAERDADLKDLKRYMERQAKAIEQALAEEIEQVQIRAEMIAVDDLLAIPSMRERLELAKEYGIKLELVQGFIAEIELLLERDRQR